MYDITFNILRLSNFVENRYLINIYLDETHQSLFHQAVLFLTVTIRKELSRVIPS